MTNIAACAVAFNITVASMAAAAWPEAADATVATMVAPWPDGAGAWVEAQMAPRQLYVAAQHHTARTEQLCQWAAAKHEGGDRYAFDYEAFRERLTHDPLGLGHPDDIGRWPQDARSKWLAEAREASERIIRDSDSLLGADRLAGPDDFGADWEAPRANGDARVRADYEPPGVVALGKPKMVIEWFSEAADSPLNAPVNPLIEDLLDEGALSVIYGDSGSGKTFAALDMGFHVGAGLDWNGKKVTRGLVIYVAAEGGKRIKRRVAALKVSYLAEHGVAEFEPLFALVRYQIDLRSSDADLNCSPLSARRNKQKAKNASGLSSTHCRGQWPAAMKTHRLTWAASSHRPTDSAPRPAPTSAIFTIPGRMRHEALAATRC
jgi:AAA domain